MRALVGGDDLGWALCLPCTGCDDSDRLAELKRSRVGCPKFDKVTPEEVASQKRALEAAMERMKKTLPWIAQMKRAHPCGTTAARTGECPICAKAITYTISAHNGHMHARCETANCVSFME